VFDVLDRRVDRHFLVEPGVEATYELDISDWPAGMYLVRWVGVAGLTKATPFLKRP